MVGRHELDDTLHSRKTIGDAISTNSRITNDDDDDDDDDEEEE